MGCGASCCSRSKPFFNYDAGNFYEICVEKHAQISAQQPLEAKNPALLSRLKAELLPKPVEEVPFFLDLSTLPLNLIGVSTLTAALRTAPPLSCLLLQQCNLPDSLIPFLMSALPSSPTLTELDLSQNSLGPGGFAAIAQGLLHENELRSLRLAHNPGRGEGLQFLSNALRSNPNLLRLDLSCVGAGDPGACHLAGALMENTHLRILNLSENQIGLSSWALFFDTLVGLEGGQQLQVVLEHNLTLVSLDLDANPIQAKHARQVSGLSVAQSSYNIFSDWGSAGPK